MWGQIGLFPDLRMANLKASKKSIRKDLKRTTQNRWWKSRVREATKNVLIAVEGKKKTDAETALKTAMTEIAKASDRGVIHANTASRKVSRLSRLVSAL